VIFAQGTPGLKAVRQHSSIMPVVFTLVADPVGQGLIQSLSRPGGYATGFTNFEFSIGGKWLELLMELDPRVKRVVLIANPANPNGAPFSQFIETSGRSVGVDVSTANVRNAADIEAAIVALARQPDGGLIVFPDSLAVVHRELITRLVVTYRVPAVYPFGIFPKNGGLSSYGLDFPELYRQAAVYVDRILRGASPADLPVQAPTKFELVINLKAAKAIGLSVPPALLARADEVIE
jgi:putative ABC transport system substrate-binding protein